jgi:Peptidase A4 family
MCENKYSLYDKVVPEGYDLLGAGCKELDSFGIPPRPDADTEPRLRAFWNKLISPPFHAKRPTFSNRYRAPHTEPHPEQPSEAHTHVLRTLMRENTRDCDLFLSRGGTTQSSLNWSGAIISPQWPKRFILATAGWKAPAVREVSMRPINTYPDDSKVLVWVGLDGYNGRLPRISLPQIGTAHFSDGTHFAWWDWWCNPPKEAATNCQSKRAITTIEDFEVNPEDEILAGLAVLISQDVLFFIKNQCTGQFRSFLAKQHSDTLPLGSSAEWVVERPTDPDSSDFHALADYGSVNFNYCMAAAADGPVAPRRRLMTLADNGRMMKMREAFPPRLHHCRVTYVSRAERREDEDGSIGVTCTFHEPT